MFTRSDQSIAFHVAMVMEDNSILLLESEGEIHQYLLTQHIDPLCSW